MTDTPLQGPTSLSPMGHTLLSPPRQGLLGTVVHILKCKPLQWRAEKSPQEGRPGEEHPAASAIKPGSNSRLICGGQEVRSGSCSLDDSTAS